MNIIELYNAQRDADIKFIKDNLHKRIPKDEYEDYLKDGRLFDLLEEAEEAMLDKMTGNDD